jgi:hypothetical protein
MKCNIIKIVAMLDVARLSGKIAETHMANLPNDFG